MFDDDPPTLTDTAVGDEVPPDLERIVRAELTAYFAGELRAFTMPLDWSGLEGLLLRVVEAITRTLPFGVTTTYGELAASLGLPGGARAVGQALGRNPLPIVVPCHRVLAARGRLGGFSSGRDRKIALLQLERVLLV